jgi:hypothetical protein
MLVESHDLHLGGPGFEQLNGGEGFVGVGKVDEDDFGGVGAHRAKQIGGLGIAVNLAGDVDVAGGLEGRDQAFTDFVLGGNYYAAKQMRLPELILLSSRYIGVRGCEVAPENGGKMP